MLTEAEIDSVVARVVEAMDPQQVIVFGSYAKGVATRTSDLDLFVIKETQLPMADRQRGLRPLRAGGVVAVDLHVYTPEEVEEYSKDRLSFVYSVLRSGTASLPRTASRLK